jgi:hypothetical protein
MRKLCSVILGLVFAASIGLTACAKKEAPPPPPPPPPMAPSTTDNAMAPGDNAAMKPGGMEKPGEAPMGEKK